MSDTITAAVGLGGGFGRGRLRERLKSRIVAAAVAKGATEDEAVAAFEQALGESDRPILDWLQNGGFEKLLEIVMTIIKLFA